MKNNIRLDYFGTVFSGYWILKMPNKDIRITTDEAYSNGNRIETLVSKILKDNGYNDTFYTIKKSMMK